jgi:PadR family transcriptional regulator PadR
MTTPTQAVLRSLLEAAREHPAREVYGLELCEQLGLGFGTVYRILARLHNAGWVNRRAEGTGAGAANRAARIYYWLTEEGADSARQALAEAAAVSAGESAVAIPPSQRGAVAGWPVVTTELRERRHTYGRPLG